MIPADMWLVPASVECFPMEGGNARLSILFSNGQRSKLDGAPADVRHIHMILLQAMSDHSTINVAQWAAMKVGSGMEWNW